ncbi:flagellar basal body-associated FliL family protein [Tissierella sp. Yu-01]|uniref:flagellar basal body-associated FliL family protein n=1 Tax=Tissierella sp. Yu-01 TaxID=3035694 RepID=UPI00240E95D9|nr:flagellar basal body-associated FliL family protein [Tissierella sp. Yu-01]WFA07889.1 flagellar basal body-associated FliL family protein [Tissierella sp. Yu-01]
MADIDVSEKKSISKIIIIALLVMILLLTAAILVFVVADNPMGNIVEVFQSNGDEYTVPLEEFVVNLKQEGSIRHYIKVTMALMFTNEDNGAIIEANVSKIRDVIISTLRSKTYTEVSDDDQTTNLKAELVKNINETLKSEIVEGVFITDVIIQ